MSSYKTVRLEERVYAQLVRRSLPRESFSETIQRLMESLDQVKGHAQALMQIETKEER